MGRTAVVVGGGIGGLAAATGLVRSGWTVRVLEQARAFTEVGAGISLWPNAFRALEALGALDRLPAGRIEGTGGVRDRRGRWIVRIMDHPAARAASASAVVVHRAELLDALLAGVPEDARLPGARVRALHADGDRTVVEHDGGSVTADLVVGADGLRSVVRRARWPGAEPPRYARRTAWRMVLDRPPGLVPSETWGPGSVFGMFPMPGDRLYCYATATVPAGERAPDDEAAELRRRFAGWHDPIPALVATARPDQVLRNDIHHLPPLDTYVSGRVVLLGDAAHAMTPNLGQGGCQALEDAATLAALAVPDADLDTALRRYDALRRPRTQRLARTSLSRGNLVQLGWGPARAARDLLLSLLPTSMFVRSLTATFDWRPPTDTDRTDRVIS